LGCGRRMGKRNHDDDDDNPDHNDVGSDDVGTDSTAHNNDNPDRKGLFSLLKFWRFVCLVEVLWIRPP